MEILSPEPPKQIDISLSDSSSDDLDDYDSQNPDFDTMRNKGKLMGKIRPISHPIFHRVN